MLQLRKFVAPEFVFGQEASKLVGQYAKNFGANKIFLVTDPGIIQTSWFTKIQQYLQQSELESFVFSEITANPRAHEVMTGVNLYHQNNCDVIVAIGGGSPMDCAKAIGIVSTNNIPIEDFEGIDNVPIPGPPLICVPTTAGTSADVSQFSFITEQKCMRKFAIISKMVVPDVALVDPQTTLTMPPYLTACSGMDAFVHAIESYVSSASSPITDVHALSAINLIYHHLAQTIDNPQDSVLREKIMLASLEAGIAFSNASLGAIHAMSHSIGGFLDIAHGECNGMLLEYVIAFNYETASKRYDKIGKIFDLQLNQLSNQEKRKLIIEQVIQFKKSIGLDKTLSAKGINKSDIVQLAHNAMQDPCMVTNPKRPEIRDIEVIYEEAL